jgi:hypothetical protein
MGGFMAAIGLGGLASGQLGALAASRGVIPVTGGIIIAALACAAALVLLQPWFDRRGL